MSGERRWEIGIADELYPPQLRDLPGPPRTLYVLGDPRVLSAPSVAVVGSRRATPYGLAVARTVATVAAQSGIAVVSGGARGCDRAGGEAALDEGGVHIAVMGCGADVVYPRSSARLIERTLTSGGAVVSLSPWGAQPRRYAFPRRNRVIAALSRALFVTEAGMPSGTFSTAEAAMEIGREVLAVPGSILSPQSRGTNYLITVGACPLVDEESIEVAVSRIFGVLRYCRVPPAAPEPDGLEARVMGALVADPMRPDDLAASLGMRATECLAYLSGLAADGLVERLADGRFAPSANALRARSAIVHNRGG